MSLITSSSLSTRRVNLAANTGPSSTSSGSPPARNRCPKSFEFTIDKKGRSTFYDEFSKYVDKTKLNAESHGVKDPVQGETEEEKEVPAAQPPARRTRVPTK